MIDSNPLYKNCDMKLKDILQEIIENRMKPQMVYPKLFKHLNELFDFENLKNIPFTKLGGDAYNFEIEINGELVDVYVDFVRSDDALKLPPTLSGANKIYNDAYAISDDMVTSQYAISDQKTIIAMMKTVSEIIANFIEKNDPDILSFFAESTDGTDRGESKKLSMYKAVIDKQKPSGYVISPVSDVRGKNGFMLYKSELIREYKINRSRK